MKINHLLALANLVLASICSAGGVMAQESVPCLIFTNASESLRCFDLGTFNRIAFSDEAMTVSSAKDSEILPVKLFYSDYHHFSIGYAMPDQLTDIREIGGDYSDSHLSFRADTKSLLVESDSMLPFVIGIYNTQGSLIATSQVNTYQLLPLGTLAPGMYIAVATDGKIKLTLKLVIK